MHAVSASSTKDIRQAKAEIHLLKDKVISADRLLQGHLRLNPYTIVSITDLESLLFDILLDHPETAAFLAAFASSFESYINGILLAGFTDLRQQLEVDEGRLSGFFKSPLTSTIVTLIKESVLEALDSRSMIKSKEAAYAFAMHLYSSGNGKFKSGTEVANYIRHCSDPNDANFKQCVEIQNLARIWGRKPNRTIDGFYATLSQRCRGHKGNKIPPTNPNAAPGPIPLLHKGL